MSAPVGMRAPAGMRMPVRIGLIAAVARNGVVGRDGALPWQIPDDLAHFKRQTRDHVIVLGRATWQEIGRPLPRRTHIVVSTTLSTPPHPDVHLAHDVDSALALGRQLEADAAGAGAVDEAIVWVIGGPRLWLAAWPQVDVAWITEIDADPAGDTHFPALDTSAFDIVETRIGVGEPPHRFVRYQRR